MEQETTITMIVIFGILIFSGLMVGAVYINHKLKVENFQITIADLSDEQKCLHICGFQYPGSTYFDQYKFCLEKCDRISERENTNCKGV